MENRINIGGVWYVRENTQPEIEFNDDDVTSSVHKSWESKNWAFKAVILLRSNAETLDDYYGDPWIDITDKRNTERTNWTTHDTDNPVWMLGVYEGNPDSMKEAGEMFDNEGIEEFKAFIGYLIKIGWIVKK